jgi:hypothetical protein
VWRTPPQPNLTSRAAARLRSRAGGGEDRQRLRLVSGLRSVARRANIRGRARRYELVLCERATLARPQLLSVAATLERVRDPEPETLAAVHRLLTDGCTSPLYNADVPPEQLAAELDRIQGALDARDVTPQELSPLPLRGPFPRAPWQARMQRM